MIRCSQIYTQLARVYCLAVWAWVTNAFMLEQKTALQDSQTVHHAVKHSSQYTNILCLTLPVQVHSVFRLINGSYCYLSQGVVIWPPSSRCCPSLPSQLSPFSSTLVHPLSSGVSSLVGPMASLRGMVQLMVREVTVRVYQKSTHNSHQLITIYYLFKLACLVK